MKLYRFIALPILITALITTACSKTSVENSSPASALKANTAIDMTAKRFGRANLGSSGPMLEFIRPEVRSRIRSLQRAIATRSGIPGDRLQVVYGGHRSQPEVEFWIVSDNGTMPEFKPENRTRPSEPEN